MMRSRVIKTVTGGALAAGAGAVAYPLFFRHWCLTWRATADEISGKRIATPGAALPVRVFTMLVMEPGSLIMERKMLLGIKQRAEDLAAEPRSRQRMTRSPARGC